MFLIEELPAFFSDLRTCGFTIGIPEQQRVNQLLLHLSALDSFPETLERLCAMLAPVICTSEQQQRLFRSRFEAHFGIGKVRRRLRSGPGPRPMDENSREERSLGRENSSKPDVSSRFHQELRRAQRRQILAGIAIFLLFVAMANVLFWVGVTEIEVHTISSAGPQTLPNQPIRPGSVSGFPTHPFLGWVSDSISQTLEVTRGTWRKALSAFGVWTLFLAIVPFAAIAVWAAAPGKKRDAFLHRRTVEGRPELLELMVSAPPLNPFLTGEVFRQSQALRRPRMVVSQEIDVDASLHSTLENLGAFTPVYARRPVAPEYLMLIERHGSDDHVAHYAESLVSTLRQAQIYVDTFYFSGDFRRVFRSPDSPRMTFEELAGRYPEHRLILVTSGSGIFDLVTGRIEEWARQVLRYPRRVLLTPAPPELWGYRELELSRALEIAVLPLLPQSLTQMAELLAMEEPVKPASPEKRHGPMTVYIERLADLLDSRPNLWLASGKPNEEVGTALESALRDALGPSGAQWFKACAVYPELHWNLTLFLGSKLRSPEGKPLFSSDRLLLLSALPWFRDGSVPTWLRKRLTESMSAVEYQSAHSVLSQLLLTVFSYGRKTFQLNISMDRCLSAVHRAAERIRGQLTDPVLADFLSRHRRTERTLFSLPEAISRSLGIGRAEGILRNVFSQSAIEEAMANSEALLGTLKLAGIGSIEVRRARTGEANESPEFRAVVRFATRFSESVEMGDDYWLYVPVGRGPAHLIDSVTADVLNFRSRLALKLSLVNVLFVLLFAMFVYAPILERYPEAVAIGFISLWMLLPFLVLHALVVRRFIACVKSFPAFLPRKGLPRHRASQFEYMKDGTRD